jgi:hypothetical protein
MSFESLHLEHTVSFDDRNAGIIQGSIKLLLGFL